MVMLNFINKLIIKKYYTICTLAFIVQICPAQDCCTNKWWQKEVATPSYNQIVNPTYLSKKREIEIACDDLREDLKSVAYYRSLGQNPSSIVESAKYIERKIRTLEYELSKIPMYISNPNYNQNNNIQNMNQQQTDIYISSPTNSNTPTTSANTYLLTLYKIRNCNKADFASDYDFNTVSLNVFNELKSNISKIVKADTELKPYTAQFAREEIKYYELFVKNWGECIGTNEAKKEIKELSDEAEKREKWALIRNTQLSIKIHFDGTLPSQEEIKRGWGSSYFKRYYVACIIKNEDGYDNTYYMPSYGKYDSNLDCRLETRGTCNYEKTIKSIKQSKLNFKIIFGTQVDDPATYASSWDNRQWLSKGNKTITVLIKPGEKTDLNIKITADGKYAAKIIYY